MTLGLNKHPTYIELLQAFPPRPIKTEEELFATQKIIDSLIDSAPLTSDEKDYLNILGTLVYEYEQTQQPVPDIYGVDLLQVLIEENGLLQKDLVPIFKTESIISAILKKRRKLTTRHIEELAEFFHISPAAFFPNYLE
ncbi:helix-turn-helix domain-containing protein [Nostoc sp. 'Lobaria pulmonaria (5183) cyanobiont']|uniref:helix-turn-helix domain-containing protein n=1 Tax=Nostoc sp. 'Lobaria pulmonaria (5183) cyanobiont' TaxID=1618022 RepID=UPI000CF31534|nr:transcriptional regulator [Nostoc sp. 'Lobaria pulmonaria (5183) cyanobiont']AVH70699.1 HTH domain-containing transcriptional regulator [Nostoc sp. 'Lobaria pulmonaria (5183) cyanobiont']